MSATLEIERRSLGRSEMTIQRVALGCGNFGGVGSAPAFFGRGLSQDEAFALMDAAWELGIRHFDTADAYGGGRSETAIGAWMRSRGCRPELTTKTFNPMSEDGDWGLKPERVLRQFESSVERLGIEHVDLYLAHDFDPEVPLDETFGALDDLVAAGRIRAYGVSNFDGAQLDAAVIAGDPVAVQNSYSLLERDDEAEVLPLCTEARVAYMAFSPLAGGWLSGKYRRGESFPEGSRMTQRPEPYHGFENDSTFDRLERLENIAERRGSSMAGTALAWLLAGEGLAQLVSGPGRPQHLEPVREALEHPLTAAERGELEEVFAC